MKFCRLTFTIDDSILGEKIISALLDRHWIACAQVTGPIMSHYHWQGTREKTPEWKFDLKTTLVAQESVIAFILEQHSYDVPEILAEEIESVNPDFSRWITEECRGFIKD
ncbi:MAG: divalent-cation tolerance protein CutA [Planctomycetia bacterium]|nr:divalent-cation tolerance protein CutA [Planctomycetia bacterium]